MPDCGRCLAPPRDLKWVNAQPLSGRSNDKEAPKTDLSATTLGLLHLTLSS
jgi:hypothetical protein